MVRCELCQQESERLYPLASADEMASAAWEWLCGSCVEALQDAFAPDLLVSSCPPFASSRKCGRAALVSASRSSRCKSSLYAVA